MPFVINIEGKTDAYSAMIYEGSFALKNKEDYEKCLKKILALIEKYDYD